MYKKICVILIVGLSIITLSSISTAIEGRIDSFKSINSFSEKERQSQIPNNPGSDHQPNIMLVCDSANLNSYMHHYSGNGYGCKFRVAGLLPSSLYGDNRAFAIGVLPECSPTILPNEKSDLSIIYTQKTRISNNENQALDVFRNIFHSLGENDNIGQSVSGVNDSLTKVDLVRIDDHSIPYLDTLAPAMAQQYSKYVGTEECSSTIFESNYDPNMSKKNFSRYLDRGFSIGYILVDGGNSDYDWTVDMREYSMAQAIQGLNNLSWLCEQKAFPVTFYVNFEYVEISQEPIKGTKLGSWLSSVNTVLGTGDDNNGIRNLVWRYAAMFGTPQGCLVYKVNDGDHEWFDDSPPNWAAMWDTCVIVGGGYCITGRSGGMIGDSVHQKWVDIHEILHTIGACDEYPGSTCNIDKCDDLKFGIYSHKNLNCGECYSHIDRCLMDSAVSEFQYICDQTARHIGLVDSNHDNGPDPVQWCSATALIADDKLRLGDIFELWTLDGYFVSGTPVSYWNSYTQSTGRRVVTIPNVNQWRNIIATTTYIYTIRHIDGSVEEPHSLPGSAWQMPDHVQGTIGSVEIVDSTLRFEMQYIANLDISIENSSGNTVAIPVSGQLFAGGETWQEVNIGYFLPDGQYTVRFRGYGIDGTGPIQRNAGVTIANGVPNAPELSLDSLDQSAGVAWLETRDNGPITQFMKLKNNDMQIDSFPPVQAVQKTLTGSEEYNIALNAGNINGETSALDTIRFISNPRPVRDLSGEVVQIVKTWGANPGELVDINVVDLYWEYPSNQQLGKLIEFVIAYDEDTISVPLNKTNLRVSNLHGNRTHEFLVWTIDSYGHRSIETSISILVGITPPFTEVPETNSSALKPVVEQKSVKVYPNPFNAITKISYELSSSGNVTVEIFNISGQKVGVLYNGFQSAGIKSFVWNAESKGSGMYFYRISTKYSFATGEIILIK